MGLCRGGSRCPWIAAARAAGATIMHAPITFAAGYNELSKHPYGILKGVVDGSAFVKDSWGAAIVDSLAPQPGDMVIEGNAISYDYPMFSEPMTAAEVIAEFS
jgi:nicotinamidase-related amidase